MSQSESITAQSMVAQTMRFDARLTYNVRRDVAVETPIAFEYNGVGYSVMMGTPADLHDYALGFTLSERLVSQPAEIEAIEPAQLPRGWVLRINLRGDRREQLQERVRLRLTEGSCGLCGLETIEQVLRPLPNLEPGPAISRQAIARALDALGDRQPLGKSTGAAHAAAFCSRDGLPLLVREDVGRHNAMDKLIGAAASAALDLRCGFILLTSRCSYELVEKAVVAGCPLLVAISAPTTLAVERARESGLTLVALARPDSMLILNNPAGTLS